MFSAAASDLETPPSKKQPRKAKLNGGSSHTQKRVHHKLSNTEKNNTPQTHSKPNIIFKLSFFLFVFFCFFSCPHATEPLPFQHAQVVVVDCAPRLFKENLTFLYILCTELDSREASANCSSFPPPPMHIHVLLSCFLSLIIFHSRHNNMFFKSPSSFHHAIRKYKVLTRCSHSHVPHPSSSSFG